MLTRLEAVAIAIVLAYHAGRAFGTLIGYANYAHILRSPHV